MIFRIGLLIFLLGPFVAFAQVSDIDCSLEKAQVQYQDKKLTVSTGRVERVWQWSGNGFQTVSYRNLESDRDWCGKKPVHSSDWDLPKRIDNDAAGKLISVDCIASDDEKFTEEHLLVTALVDYECGLDVKFLIRVYPDAPGIWTALEVRADDTFSTKDIPVDLATYKYYGSNQPVKIARSEFTPVDFSEPNQRRYWGIYNNPGNRVNTKDMVKEKVIKGFPIFQDEQISWANGLVVEKGEDGLILVKESNKTVNKYGHQTGSFYCTPDGVEVTGWGIKPDEISGEFKRSWATWSILYTGAEDEMELALKTFDRIRYPVNIETDMHILIDTWGSDWQNGNYDKIYGRENSTFDVVEREIRSAADLGIDIVRIDDGWQEGGTLSKNSWHPNTKVGYDPNWAKTKKLSEETGVRIGLWAAVRFITPDEMLKNQEELDVATWKFDFDKLEDHDSFSDRIKGIRAFIKETNYTTQTSWCPEYDDQRYGWYSPARECGPMYFQNLQNNLPNHIVYVPYITLRHHWMMSKFYNMNDLQCHWQNPARTNPELSDANQHSQSYCALSAFMTAPSCFMLTQFLEPDQRDELRNIIAIYKKHRREIFESFVFPLGSEPDNASWTGFQIHHPEKKSGYLMIFRELHNEEANKTIRLRFLKNKTLKIRDLIDETCRTVKLSDDSATFEIKNPAGIKFIKYEIVE